MSDQDKTTERLRRWFHVDEPQVVSEEFGEAVANSIRADVLTICSQVDNLAQLVRRLCRKLPDDCKLKSQALDYLKRQDLQGSILR